MPSLLSNSPDSPAHRRACDKREWPHRSGRGSEGIAQITPRIAKFGVEPHGFAVGGNRFIEPARKLPGDAEIVSRFHVIRRETERLPVSLGGFVMATQGLERDPEIIVGFGRIRIEAEALREGRDGFNESALEAKRVSEFILAFGRRNSRRFDKFASKRRLAPAMPHLAKTQTRNHGAKPRVSQSGDWIMRSRRPQ